jgi:putative SOS response-associated peptidase YedK
LIVGRNHYILSKKIDYMIIIGQVANMEEVEGAFEVVNKFEIEPSKNYALYPEDQMCTITSKDCHSLVQASYGLVPFWATTFKASFEAPVEGKRSNSDDPILKKGIINEPYFRKPIRETRAIIPVDYFILSEQEKAMLFFTESRPFAIGGVVDYWKPSILEKKLHAGIAILTMPAQGIFKDCGFERQPMIIENKGWKHWLKDIALTEITNMIDYFPDKRINGFPVDNALIQSGKNDKSVIEPHGNFIREHTKLNTKEKFLLKFRRGERRPHYDGKE